MKLFFLGVRVADTFSLFLVGKFFKSVYCMF